MFFYFLIFLLFHFPPRADRADFFWSCLLALSIEKGYWHEHRNSLPEFECLREISCGKDTDHSKLRKLKIYAKTYVGNVGIFKIFR